MTSPTEFLNVQVVAIPKTDSTGKVSYETTFTPEAIVVKAHDTVINYQIVDPTPAGVEFSSVSIAPDHEKQLSDPSISRSGKLVTFSDANTIRMSLNLTFHFKDTEGTDFLVDPEIDNDPPPDLPQSK